MSEVLQFLLQLLGIVAVGGAVYGGIRSDLRALHAAAERAYQRADGAHSRIDSLLMGPRR